MTSGVAFLVEGETDTMRLWQELDEAADVYGLPGVKSWKSEWAGEFTAYDSVFVILDNDQDYMVKAQVDAAWRTIRRDLGPKAKRIYLPTGIKDVCEFFAAGLTLDDLRAAAMKPQSRYKPLDLHDTWRPRPVNWMVEGLIGHGDVGVLFGEPNVGKSWLSLSLALALVQGWDTWLGLALKNHGRVLYVDEENPEDVVFHRLQQLGIRPEDADNLRYLHDQGIRLDRDPDALLEEALNFEPTLIVVDSLTRVHTGEENDAGFIARLFNDGIKPLSRQTGATVLVLHHANKVTEGNSYKRMRGSIDIGAAFDTGLDVRAVGPGFLSVAQFKSRRRLPHRPITVRLMDTEDGMVKLVTNVEAPPPL